MVLLSEKQHNIPNLQAACYPASPEAGFSHKSNTSFIRYSPFSVVLFLLRLWSELDLINCRLNAASGEAA